MIIYKTTNLINGKIYIGKAIEKSSGYLGSGKILKLAIKKYGRDNFKRETIDRAANLKDQREKEIYWIDFYNSRNPEIGYNITPGGEGFHGSHTEKTKEKLRKWNSLEENKLRIGVKVREALKGKKHTEQRRRNESLAKTGEKHPCYGKHLSEETKRKISESNKIAFLKRMSKQRDASSNV